MISRRSKRFTGRPAAVVVAPTFSAAPTVLGVPTAGTAAAFLSGTYNGTAPLTVSYRWRVDGADVGSVNTPYAPITGDVGKLLTVRQTVTGPGGSVSSTSVAAVVAAAGSQTYGTLGRIGGNPDPAGELFFTQATYNVFEGGRGFVHLSDANAGRHYQPANLTPDGYPATETCFMQLGAGQGGNSPAGKTYQIQWVNATSPGTGVNAYGGLTITSPNTVGDTTTATLTVTNNVNGITVNVGVTSIMIPRDGSSNFSPSSPVDPLKAAFDAQLCGTRFMKGSNAESTPVTVGARSIMWSGHLAGVYASGIAPGSAYLASVTNVSGSTATLTVQGQGSGVTIVFLYPVGHPQAGQEVAEDDGPSSVTVLTSPDGTVRDAFHPHRYDGTSPASQKARAWKMVRTTSEWADRAKWAERQAFTGQSKDALGWPVEFQIRMANDSYAINARHKQLWFAGPGNMSTGYVTSWATTIRDGLAPQIQVQFEVGNEGWNALLYPLAVELSHTALKEVLAGGSNLNSDNHFSLADNYLGGNLRARLHARRTRDAALALQTVFGAEFGTRCKVVYAWLLGTGSTILNALNWLNATYGAGTAQALIHRISLSCYVFPEQVKGTWVSKWFETQDMQAAFVADINRRLALIAGDIATLAPLGIPLNLYEIGLDCQLWTFDFVNVETVRRARFVATPGQTVFAMSMANANGALEVWRGGVQVAFSVAGDNVTLTTPASNGDIVYLILPTTSGAPGTVSVFDQRDAIAAHHSSESLGNVHRDLLRGALELGMQEIYVFGVAQTNAYETITDPLLGNKVSFGIHSGPYGVTPVPTKWAKTLEVRDTVVA